MNDMPMVSMFGGWLISRYEAQRSLWLYDAFKHLLLSGEPDYFGRNKISSGGDLSHYSSASLY